MFAGPCSLVMVSIMIFNTISDAKECKPSVTFPGFLNTRTLVGKLDQLGSIRTSDKGFQAYFTCISLFEKKSPLKLAYVQGRPYG